MLNFIHKLENWFYEESIQNKLLYLGFGVVFVLIFALNYFYPLYCDDMAYSMVKYGETLNLSQNIKEIGEFIHLYYFEWGGRVVAHIIAHIILLFSPIGQDIINSLVFCCLAYFAYKIAMGDKKNNLFIFIFIVVSVFYFTPAFLSSAVWITGSANYLWTTVLTLAFLYPLQRYFYGKTYKNSVLNLILFFLFGIVAGCTNENLGPILVLMTGGYLSLFFFYQKKEIPNWAIAATIGVVIGCALMIFAPGNAVRAEAEGHAGLFSSIERIPFRFQYIIGSYNVFMLRLIIIYCVSIVIHHFYAKDNERRKSVFLVSLLFFVAANLAIWITILAPTFPPRAFMSITVLTIVAIALLYANIDLRKMVPKVINISFLTVLIFFATIDYLTFLKGVYFLDKQFTKREIVIAEAKAKGEAKVRLESIHMDYRFEYTDFAFFYKIYYDIDFEFYEK